MIAEKNLSEERQKSSLETLLSHVKQANFLIENYGECSCINR